MFKVNNKNTIEHISHVFSHVSFIDFEQVNVSWVISRAPFTENRIVHAARSFFF